MRLKQRAISFSHFNTEVKTPHNTLLLKNATHLPTLKLKWAVFWWVFFEVTRKRSLAKRLTCQHRLSNDELPAEKVWSAGSYSTPFRWNYPTGQLQIKLRSPTDQTAPHFLTWQPHFGRIKPWISGCRLPLNRHQQKCSPCSRTLLYTDVHLAILGINRN